VIGALRKTGTKKVKRLLILGGHHDSAPENTWLRFLGYGFMPASATPASDLTTIRDEHIQLAGVITGNAGIVRTERWDGFCWSIQLCLPSIY
jgi:hypothetical protein